MVHLYLLHSSAVSRGKHTALGQRLLLFALSEHGFAFTNDDIHTGEFGKPYIPGAPEFSISHSGKTVACALSDSGPVGVDVETVAQTRDGVAGRFFTPAECRMAKSGLPFDFYEIWTKKESFLKMLGTGFAVTPRSFDTVTGDGTSGAYFYGFAFAGAAGCVCTKSYCAVQTVVVCEDLIK